MPKKKNHNRKIISVDSPAKSMRKIIVDVNILSDLDVKILI